MNSGSRPLVPGSRLPARRRRPLRHRRRGYTLVIFTLLFFCLMALGAIIIDIGLARMTQRQMLSAVDAAAVDGLRGRDRLDSPDSETMRRQSASDLAAQVFDDDLDPASGDPRSFGAGPRIELTDGIPVSPEFSASQLITIPNPPVYDPVLRLNVDNASEGDLVAGTYDNALGLTHMENSDYSRDDFAPTAEGDDAFLVRMRRTTETFDPAVGESGGTIPYLFGRGSLLNVAVRGRGIAVRATAIAQARRAMAIGRRALESPAAFPGALPFVVEISQWPSLVNSVLPLEIEGTELRLSGQRVGYLYDLDASDGLGQSLSFGQTAPADPQAGTLGGDVIFSQAAQRTGDPSGPRFGYVAIVGSVGSGGESRVVAFGAMELTSGTAATLPFAVLENFLGPENASPVLARPLDVNVFANEPNDPELTDLLSQHRLPSAPQTPLLAPALVR
ncbi:MAG TPA: Tad domain-containing protein [Pirellulaceae bacterium]|nr:Tad domain-containing protein [Pirellulaceae bacterium]